ncbi:hypothetical protein AB5I41_11820 [Sphingomonas sp. MMS24-JH45]
MAIEAGEFFQSSYRWISTHWLQIAIALGSASRSPVLLWLRSLVAAGPAFHERHGLARDHRPRDRADRDALHRPPLRTARVGLCRAARERLRDGRLPLHRGRGVPGGDLDARDHPRARSSTVLQRNIMRARR